MKDIARQSITIDPDFQSIWGDLDEETFNNLKTEIQADGIRDSLVLWTHDNRNILVDGHNRLRIADQLHINPVPVVWKEFKDKSEASVWIVTHQVARRNLTDYERSVLALKLKPMIAEKAKEKMEEGVNQYSPNQKSDKPTINTTKELAKVAGVSHDTIHKVETIEAKATPETKQLLKDGKLSINKAYQEVKKPSKPKKQKPLEPVEDFLNRSRTEAKATETRTAIGVVSVQAQKITEERLNELKTVYKKSEMEEAVKQIKFMIENCQRAIDACNKFLEGSDEERTG